MTIKVRRMETIVGALIAATLAAGSGGAGWLN